MQETWVHSLGQEDPLEKEMATRSSILAWKIHGQRSLVGYIPRGREESDMTERLTHTLLPSCKLQKEMAGFNVRHRAICRSRIHIVSTPKIPAGWTDG